MHIKKEEKKSLKLPLMEYNHWHFCEQQSVTCSMFSSLSTAPASPQLLPGPPGLPIQHFTLNSLIMSVVFSYMHSCQHKSETILYILTIWNMLFHLRTHIVYLSMSLNSFLQHLKMCHNLKLLFQDQTSWVLFCFILLLFQTMLQ